MADKTYTIAGGSGKRATRELLVTYLNTGTYESPHMGTAGAHFLRQLH